MYTPPPAGGLAVRQPPSLGMGGVLNVSEIGLPYLDPDNGDLYVIRDSGNRIDRSTDGGFTFTTVADTSSYGALDMLKLSDGHWLIWPTRISTLVLLAPDWSVVTTTISTGGQHLTLGINMCVDYKPAEGIIMFCNYITDASSPNQVLRSVDNGRSFSVVLEPVGVRHNHSLQVDPFTGSWWMFTGDTAEQTKVYRSQDDGDTWEVIAEGQHINRAIGAVFTRESIMWATDEIETPARFVITSRDAWNPVEFGTSLGPILGNRVTANGLMVSWMRCEAPSPEKDVGRVFLSDGERVQEIYSNREVTPDGVYGFTNASKVDKLNRIWVAVPQVGLVGLALPYVVIP